MSACDGNPYPTPQQAPKRLPKPAAFMEIDPQNATELRVNERFGLMATIENRSCR